MQSYLPFFYFKSPLSIRYNCFFLGKSLKLEGKSFLILLIVIRTLMRWGYSTAALAQWFVFKALAKEVVQSSLKLKLYFDFEWSIWVLVLLGSGHGKWHWHGEGGSKGWAQFPGVPTTSAPHAASYYASPAFLHSLCPFLLSWTFGTREHQEGQKTIICLLSWNLTSEYTWCIKKQLIS